MKLDELLQKENPIFKKIIFDKEGEFVTLEEVKKIFTYLGTNKIFFCTEDEQNNIYVTPFKEEGEE